MNVTSIEYLAEVSTVDLFPNSSNEFFFNWTSLTNICIQRYTAIGFSYIVACLAFYIMIVLAIYAWRNKMCSCSGDNYKAGNSTSTTDTAILNGLTMVTAFSVLIYMAVELPLLWPMQEPYCHLYHQTKIVCTAVGLFTVYFTLWYRVYTVFYLNPFLRRTTSPLARIFNKLTVVLLVCMTSANIIAFLTSPLYVTTPIGCMKVQKTKDARLKWGLLVSTTLTFQMLLLFSLIYPLQSHRKTMLNRGLEGSSIMPVVKRAAVVAGVCMLSDATNAVYALTNKQKVVYVRHMVYGSNMLINLLALLMSFSNWRDRLFPCRAQTRRSGKRTSIASTGTKSTRASVV